VYLKASFARLKSLAYAHFDITLDRLTEDNIVKQQKIKQKKALFVQYHEGIQCFQFFFFFDGACVLKHWLQAVTNTSPLLLADEIEIEPYGGFHHGEIHFTDTSIS
jgi:hypothetical protein